MLKNLKAFNLTSHTFIMKVYTFFVSSVLAASLFFSCSSEPKKSEEEKVEKQDSSSKAEVVKTDKSLVGEWVLDRIDSKVTDIALNFIFKENGEFTSIGNSETVNGAFTLSEDGKKITLKSKKGEDLWSIVEQTDSILDISVTDKEGKITQYTFKK